ncbi:MAG: MBL fold metallo-hydrolase [Anaerolineae bacterium]|nr:MBL fold metallo-hydrolase [Anaerolineae bacterium]
MILQLPIGMLGSNCYLILDPSTGIAAIVDPGFEDPAPVRDAIDAHRAHVRYILDTHGHFDHIAGNGALACPGVVLGIHPEDRKLLLSGGGAGIFGLPIPSSPEPELALREGTTLSLGAIEVTVLHTPGHTPGSICLYVASDQALLTGDTLFRDGVGRTDLPGGSAQALAASLRRIAELPPETRIYPGHGSATTLARERAHNPWLQALRPAG